MLFRSLWIDTVLEKIVRAGLVGSMMETDGPLRRFFLGLMGTCHDERPKYFPSDRPSWKALNPKLFYLIQQWLTSLLLSSGQVSRFRLAHHSKPKRVRRRPCAAPHEQTYFGPWVAGSARMLAWRSASRLRLKSPTLASRYR